MIDRLNFRGVWLVLTRASRLLPVLMLATGWIVGCEDQGAPTTPVPPTPPPTPSPTPAPTPPAVPTGLRVSASGHDFIEWSWDAVEGIGGYEVQFSLDEVFDGTDEIAGRTAAQTSYRRQPLPAGATAFLRVRSVTGAGDESLRSDWSAAVTGVTTGPTPPAVPKLAGFLKDWRSITWRWQPVEGVDGYRVQYSVHDEVFTEDDRLVELPSTQHSFQVDLGPGVTVSFRIQSFVGVGTDRVKSAWSTPLTTSTLGGESSALRPHDGEFTDSQGRTIAYRLFLDDAWSTSEPRGVVVHFHGNSKGTQQDMLGGYPAWMSDAGLAYAKVASPESVRGEHPAALLGSLTGAGGTRHWSVEDARLVHELLQSGFNSSLVIDYDAVVFWGQSQGAVFLTDFVERFAGVYGGGFWAHCGGVGIDGTPLVRHRFSAGPKWEPSFPWTSSSSLFVRERFRIFVEITTGDFLHARGLKTVDYYSDILGLDVQAETDAPGGHCETGRVAWTQQQVVQWLLEGGRQMRTRIRRDGDADADGIPDVRDGDDDGDGAPDFLDALPLDAREWLDTDADGVGNFLDRDADGDGVDNAADAFPLDLGESADTDGDGVGDNLDDDDDNDGLRDEVDGNPSVLPGGTGGLVLKRVTNYYYSPAAGSARSAVTHSRKPAGFVYPGAEGTQQSYQYLELGDGAPGERSRIQIMIDRFDTGERCETTLLSTLCGDGWAYSGYWHDRFDKIYVDRNNNRDLTDDGPALMVAVARDPQFGWRFTDTAMVTVSYASGERLPYWLGLWVPDRLTDGAFYLSRSVWQGTAESPRGDGILVATLDGDTDGRFDSEESDLVCIDLDRNGILDECKVFGDGASRTVANGQKPGARYMLDGREYRVTVAPSGRRVQFVSAR